MAIYSCVIPIFQCRFVCVGNNGNWHGLCAIEKDELMDVTFKSDGV